MFKLPPKTSALRKDISNGFLATLEDKQRQASLLPIGDAHEVFDAFFANDPFAVSMTMYARSANNELLLVRNTRYNNFEILWNFGELI